MGVWISRGNFISLLYKACAVSLYTILVRKIGGHFVTLFFNMSQNDLKLPNRILLIFSAIHIKSFAFRFATPITSPICGTVLAKYAEAGELATQGKPLFKVADVQHLFLRAYITADQLSQLKLGDKVKVFSDLGEDDRREYEGTITWISDKSEFTPKTIQTRDERANLVYATKIAVKNDGYIKIGMYGEMKK